MREMVDDVLDSQAATIVLLAAEPGKTLAKYENGASLVWRDAGALLATMAFAAHSLGMNFCPLGITGERCVRSLDPHRRLVGVGVALLGARRAE